MVKKGTKITCPKRLAILAKARKKALEVRRRNSELKRKEKLLKAMDRERRTKEVNKKLDDALTEPVKEEMAKEHKQPDTPPHNDIKKEKKVVSFKVEEKPRNEVVVSQSVVHPTPKPKQEKYNDPTTDDKPTNLVMTSDGRYVQVPLDQFNKFMFKYRGEQEQLKKNKVVKKPDKGNTTNNYYYGRREQPLQKRLQAKRGQTPKKPKTLAQIEYDRIYNGVNNF